MSTSPAREVTTSSGLAKASYWSATSLVLLRNAMRCQKTIRCLVMSLVSVCVLQQSEEGLW